MMKNKLIDLNNHLFAQIERMSDESMDSDNAKLEIERSRAISQLSKQVISNASLALRAEQFKAEYGISRKLPGMLEQL